MSLNATSYPRPDDQENYVSSGLVEPLTKNPTSERGAILASSHFVSVVAKLPIDQQAVFLSRLPPQTLGAPLMEGAIDKLISLNPSLKKQLVTILGKEESERLGIIAPGQSNNPSGTKGNTTTKDGDRDGDRESERENVVIETRNSFEIGGTRISKMSVDYSIGLARQEFKNKELSEYSAAETIKVATILKQEGLAHSDIEATKMANGIVAQAIRKDMLDRGLTQESYADFALRSNGIGFNSMHVAMGSGDNFWRSGGEAELALARKGVSHEGIDHIRHGSIRPYFDVVVKRFNVPPSEHHVDVQAGRSSALRSRQSLRTAFPAGDDKVPQEVPASTASLKSAANSSQPLARTMAFSPY